MKKYLVFCFFLFLIFSFSRILVGEKRDKIEKAKGLINMGDLSFEKKEYEKVLSIIITLYKLPQKMFKLNKKL